MARAISEFIEQHQLPKVYGEDLYQLEASLSSLLSSDKTQFIAINGAQGSGKSTLSAALAALWQAQGLSVAVVSLDDYYLSQSERMQLAMEIHPLFRTRGVPGTHHIKQAIEDIQLLKKGLPVTLPCFDKSSDEPFAKSEHKVYEKRVDRVIFEGWCMALEPQSAHQLVAPINDFEARYDQSGDYRKKVNQFLEQDYQALFALFDCVVFLDVGDFERVYQWRIHQEHRLIENMGKGMSDAQVRQFIQYFERLTRWAQKSLPQRADLWVTLNENQRMTIKR